ncbi:guanine nucleotide exchange factor VAV2-like isoform X2 [Dendronephthya gigantea]|uniref:guanine nucleotide exchange factor VAV2-like isoform X2 n=1 Tax=Dendronephthya gigantea TaxID=151771 RepID=UPI001069E921|nr:guanine nucleotide exchange factor VAV2-like isoform X2 [Dendronephthya gigantea]
MAGRRISQSNQELWLMAKNWLASTNVLPQGHRCYDSNPTVFDLAHSLRDGVALCQVANCLRPYSVRDINLKPQMSPFLCLKNIRAFLHACEKHFGLKESVLFDAHELYDVSDFGKVVITLSHLSKCKDALNAGFIPFPSDRAASLNSYYKDEDIYGNLEEIALTKDVAEENVYDAVTIEDDNKIYDDIVAIKKRLDASKSQDSHSSKADEKRSYVIEELLGTEKNYVEALTSIKENFIDQLQNTLSAVDSKKIFVNILDLLSMHHTFLGKLKLACRAKKDVGSAISNCFIIDKDKFLEYGKYCREMQAAQNHVDKLCENDAEINRHLKECCQNANGGKFSLRSLLVVPMQRVLKYPLLLRELIKHSKTHKTDKDALEKALAAMQDVAHFINAVKRDDESTSAVQQIQASLIRDKDAPPNLIEFGLLVKDGDMQIKMNEDKTLKKRYAFLFDRVLLMCKVRGEQYDHKETLYLDHYDVSDTVTHSGKGKFVHGWTMNGNSPEAGRGSYEMFTKTDDMKRKWVEDIQRTISNLTLADYNLGNHRLELTTFAKPTYCSVCKNLLWGLINQGYTCKACSHVCHKECIEKSAVCKSSKSGTAGRRTIVKQPSEPVPNSPPLPPRSRNNSAPVVPSWTPSTVVAITRFHGWAPGKKNTLVFEAGEEIDVLKSPDPEWWEGKSRKTGKQGYFPRNYVEILEDRKGKLQREFTKYEKSSDLPTTTEEVLSDGEIDLTKYQWFVGKMGRDEAKELLEKLSDGTFLIRESTTVPGQYALSLKHKYNVKHIKIVVSTGMFCLTALKLFPSVANLIDYYRNNTLGVSFPGLDTCLTRGINEARRKSPPQIIAYARAKYDYEARDPREISIKKNTRILVINKDGEWWKGENEEGQVGFFPSNFVQTMNGDSHGS